MSTADMAADYPRTPHHLGGAVVRSNSYKICEEVGRSSKVSQYSSPIPPQRMSGLNLPSLSGLYKQLQVSRQCQLLTSADACVRHLAEKHLQNEDRLFRKSFKPAVIVRDTLADDPGRNRKALSLAANREVKDREARQRLSQVQQLSKQGEMIHAISSETAAVWAKAVQALSSNTEVRSQCCS